MNSASIEQPSETLYLINKMNLIRYYLCPQSPCTTYRCPGSQGFLTPGHILHHNTTSLAYYATEDEEASFGEW